ncbi:MAG: EamA family transporter [Deltaproteobacteria bacterium]|nr:EamA family transporter [Deltaproteobacteria bacterium]
MLGAALLFSTGGAAIKTATLDGWQVAGLRALFALVAIMVLVPGPVALQRRSTAMVGAAQAATMLLFVLANKLTTSANAIFLQCTGPLYLPLLGPLLIGERAKRSDWWAMAVIGGGMALFFVGTPATYATAPQPRLGDALAIGSGFAWSLTVLGYRWTARSTEHRDFGAKSAMLWGNALVVVAALPMALPLVDVSIADWSVLVYLGVVQTALAYRLLARGLRRLPAMEAALLGFFEPVLNPIWAYLVHAEVPSAWAMAGASVIAVVTISRAVLGSRR